MVQLIKDLLQTYHDSPEVSPLIHRQGMALYLNGQVTSLSQGPTQSTFGVSDTHQDFETRIVKDSGEHLVVGCTCRAKGVCSHRIAALQHFADELSRTEAPNDIGKQYTREGMIQRVLEERKSKALKAEYRMELSDNKHGPHLLHTERDITYSLTMRDFGEEQGYCSCPDFRANKLCTCKHLMYAFRYMKQHTPDFVTQDQDYPFVEIYLDPQRDYQIAWYHSGELSAAMGAMLDAFFDENHLLPENQYQDFLNFLDQAEEHKQFLIRPEVLTTLESFFNKKALEQIAKESTIDYSLIKADLYPYQKEGVEFAAFKEGVIIGDEMGLGKTLQAITAAIIKKEVFGFKRTLVICPASLKDQWKQEIEKFSNEKACVIEGFPEDRAELYRSAEEYFLILNYETVLRDAGEINKYNTDFIILDEAQRIKNYETRTAHAVKSLNKKHCLVITGTPIENRLIDLFSIVEFIDPYFLAPLWEFSYQHCFFDEYKKNKITGYYNLQSLKKRLKPILLRRTKQEVLKQLPNLTESNVPVELHPVQAEYHASYAQGIARLVRKKFLTPYDLRRLQLLLMNMRMVCDSSFLVDKESYHSPKLTELRHILIHKLDLRNSDRKVIIFTEWTTMQALIGKMLREAGLTYAELNGKIPVKKRQALVEHFMTDPDCNIFLSTEAGGSGLNLQVADTVINFELPWNPAKKNQRIGRIDRLGQKNEHLNVFNLVTRKSIEMRIASGLILKQNLFESVLNDSSTADMVDFSRKGQAQFLKELELMIDELGEPGPATRQTAAMEETITEDAPVDTTQEIGEASQDTQTHSPEAAPRIPKPKEVEEVMNQGMGFLAGLFKMATGKDMTTEGQSIEVNPETGEVVMRFKMPV
ncbi:MAG: SNF2-related protein [Bacteroidia bacterium]